MAVKEEVAHVDDDICFLQLGGYVDMKSLLPNLFQLLSNGYLSVAIVLEFALKEVFDLSLSGFSHQNVVNSLTFEKVENGYRVTRRLLSR